MAQEGFLSNHGANASDTFEEFLNQVQTETKERVDNFLKPLIRTAENGRDSENELSKQLEDALAQSDVVEVWKLIAETDSKKTLENLNDVCEAIVKRENNKENRCHFKCSWDCKKICETIGNSLCTFVMCTCNVDEFGETETEMRSEEERRWIEILSNPLYISLEWLWRNNPNSQYIYDKGERRKESTSTDIIEAALNDAYLLNKIASYEHYYSRDEYKRRAEEYETFAADIVQQVDTSDLKQLHQIMDIEGNGSLLEKTPANFNQSLSLLKLAADKKRKRVGIRLEWSKIEFRHIYVIF